MVKRIYEFVADWDSIPGKKKNTGSLVELLGFLALFYPKTGMCWTVYMSMLGSFGMAKLSPMVWFFPALLLFLMLHLWALLKNVRQKKIYFPFLLSLIGTLFILTGRMFLPVAQWPVITGILLLVLGSLSNGLVDSKRTDSLAVPVE